MSLFYYGTTVTGTSSLTYIHYYLRANKWTKKGSKSCEELWERCWIGEKKKWSVLDKWNLWCFLCSNFYDYIQNRVKVGLYLLYHLIIIKFHKFSIIIILTFGKGSWGIYGISNSSRSCIRYTAKGNRGLRSVGFKAHVFSCAVHYLNCIMFK